MRKELYKGKAFMSKCLNCIVEPFLTIEHLKNNQTKLTVRHVPLSNRREHTVSEETVASEFVKYATKGLTGIK